MEEPQRVAVHGKQLQCAHCGNTRFTRRRAQLNTAFLSFMNMEWLNESADVYVCAHCGRLEWFVQPVPQMEDDGSEPIECFSCGATLGAGERTCPRCGWTYMG